MLLLPAWLQQLHPSLAPPCKAHATAAPAAPHHPVLTIPCSPSRVLLPFTTHTHITYTSTLPATWPLTPKNTCTVTHPLTGPPTAPPPRSSPQTSAPLSHMTLWGGWSAAASETVTPQCPSPPCPSRRGAPWRRPPPRRTRHSRTCAPPSQLNPSCGPSTLRCISSGRSVKHAQTALPTCYGRWHAADRGPVRRLLGEACRACIHVCERGG